MNHLLLSQAHQQGSCIRSGVIKPKTGSTWDVSSWIMPLLRSMMMEQQLSEVVDSEDDSDSEESDVKIPGTVVKSGSKKMDYGENVQVAVLVP